MRIPSIISIALFATLAPAASAQTNAPLAPGTARVVGIRTMNTYEESSSSWTDSNGKVRSGGSGGTSIRQVYKLETDKSFMEVTGYENVFKAHGRPALQIGDVVPYEIDPKHGQYVKLQLVQGKKQKTKWHDFLRVSAEAKPNA
jgi:hypothetical protein